MEYISGDYVGFNENKGMFKYAYVCPECHKKFYAHCPELSVPSLCHLCYAGIVRVNKQRQHRRNKFRT